MKPFLLLATRSDDVAADDEYAAILRLGSLTPAQLHRVRLEAGPMPAIELVDYSGVILGGSPFTSSDPVADKSATQLRVEEELAEFLTRLWERDFPFLGACYGVGTLGQLIGAVIDGTYGEPVSAPWIQLTDAGREDPLLAGVPQEFQAIVGHKEACTQLPASAELLATSAACPVQMFRVGEHMYGTQFHPELDHAGLHKRMVAYRDLGYFEPAEFESVFASVAEADVAPAGRIISNFVSRYRRD